MISEANRNKLFQSDQYLELIIAEGLRIIDENKNSFNIYHSLFKRSIFCFESLKILLKDYDDKNRYRELPIAIILRASLLDYLVIIYLATYQAEKKQNPKLKPDYNKIINRLYSEQIRRTVDVNEKNKKYHFYNHKEHCEYVDLIKQEFGHLFNPEIAIDYNKPSKSLIYKQKDDITNHIIRKRLDSVSDRLENIRYEDVFYLYDLYSKYDHFGTASMLLESINIDLFATNILGSIFHICEGTGFCIDLLREETKCGSDFNKIENQLGCLRGIIH